MRLKISSPEKVIYEGFIEKVSIPTESGEVVILPQQTPLVSALKPGIVKVFPEGKKSVDYISISKGMMFTDGKKIRIVTSSATNSPEESEENLLKSKQELENKIKELKKSGSIEEIEKYTIKLEKINADLSLKKIKN
ncbi:ATP synthase F1 subunit epsilon [Candidatus Gracilibacteria bacterium]|nr:ATP synthase F1 subunit epsilon [Candidatus Gracilibacteria bacterium]